MIVVDSSVLVAIVFGEPDCENLRTRLSAAPEIRSAATLLEAAMVVEGGQGPAARDDLDALVEQYGMIVTPFDSSHLTHARDAFRRYGKGRHPARLNFGDCIAYGLAKALGLPLLHKGTDFAATDLPG